MDVETDTLAVRRRASPLRMLMLALVAVAAMPNGLYFSPWFDSVLFMVQRPASAFFLKGPMELFYLSGILLWLLTLVLAGIPAALYERLRGLKQPTFGAMLIWLLAALVLGIPSFQAALEVLSEPA